MIFFFPVNIVIQGILFILDLYLSQYLHFHAVLFLVVNVNNVQPEVIIREIDSLLLAVEIIFFLR